MLAINTPSPLVYLNVQTGAGQVKLKEHEFTAGLRLQPRLDDPRLLIALGEISGSQRPLTVRRISRFHDLLILWLSGREWLVIPLSPPEQDLENALYQAFGPQITLDLIPDGTFQARLSAEAWRQLQGTLSEDHPGSEDYPHPGHADSRSVPNQQQPGAMCLEGVCIHPWTRLCAYDLLLSHSDAMRLRDWLPAARA